MPFAEATQFRSSQIVLTLLVLPLLYNNPCKSCGKYGVKLGLYVGQVLGKTWAKVRPNSAILITVPCDNSGKRL